MKRKFALLVALLALLALSACTTQEPAPTPSPEILPTATPAPTPEPTLEVGPVPEPVWEEKEERRAMNAPDGTEVFTYTSRRLHIRNTGASEGYRKIEDFYQVSVLDYLEYSDLALAEYQEAKEKGYEFLPHAVEEDSQVVYQDERLASLLRTVYRYAGGAYPELTYTGDTFDLASGERLALAELFTVGPEDYRARLLEQIQALGKLRVLEDGTPILDERILEEQFVEENFYLSDAGVVIYYQGDGIPHAVGVQEFTIPYAELEDILIEW